MDEVTRELQLIQLLDDTHQWPSLYSFKFIVPAPRGPELEGLFQDAQSVETRPSASGKYTAYTFHCPMGSGREVVTTYARVSGIQGLISL